MTRPFMRTGIAAVALLSITACSPFYAVRPSAPAASAPAVAPAPQPVPQTPRDRLIASVEQSGCMVTRDNRDAVLARADLSTEQFASITRELQGEGRVEVPPGGTGAIRLLSANCI